jgi:hypothetical protein
MCPRHWFYRHYFGFEPKTKAGALLFGTAIHAAVEAFLNTADPIAATSAAEASLISAKHNYKFEENYEKDRKRIGPLVEKWCANLGIGLLNNYDVVKTELELTSPEGLTGRLDFVLREKHSPVLFVGEVKSTSFSLTEMLKTVGAADQLTMYTYLLKNSDLVQRKGMFVSGGLLNVLYSRGSVCEVALESTYVDQNMIDEYLVGLLSTLDELALRLYQIDCGKRSYAMTRHPGHQCSFCPFADVCRLGRVDATEDNFDSDQFDREVIDTTKLHDDLAEIRTKLGEGRL